MNLVLQQVADPEINKRPPFPPAMTSGIAAMMHDCLLADPEERPSLNELSSRINRFKPEDVEPKVEGEEAPAGSMGYLNKRFPTHVAQALSEGRAVEPVTHNNATVFYCEIDDFARISTELAPIKVADLMHRVFDKFDTLAEKHKVFKVNMSAGGAWMGATNCVQHQVNDHAKRIAEFAMATVQAAGEILIDEGHPERGCVDLHAAIHSGSVAGHVLGSHTPQYSLSGEAVDVATDLARKSLALGILCSEASANLLKEQAPKVPTRCKGRSYVSGQGVMTVFWVNFQEVPVVEKDATEVEI